MEIRMYEQFDDVTSHNLRRLDHLSRQTYTVSRNQLDDFLIAVIQTHRLLPSPIQKKIAMYRCFTLGRHDGMDQIERDQLWLSICKDLTKGLDSVIQDESLHIVYEAGVDRLTTLGEKILALCDDYETAYDVSPVLAKMAQLGVGTDVARDAKELQRLFSKKRVADAGRHDADIRRCLAHIKIVAHGLHHKPA